MKTNIIFFVLSLMLSACIIQTPVVEKQVVTTPSSTNVITTPTTHSAVQAQNVTVKPMHNDYSYHLDLQAIAIAFGRSTNLNDFEMQLNHQDSRLSNLDLNGDGYVDYLRVVEVSENGVNIIVLQAILAQDIYQDVASIVVERQNERVQIIGNPYIYGHNYILEPVYVSRPIIYNSIWAGNYQSWTSPYRWNYYPTTYRNRTPMQINNYYTHIDGYVNKYQRNCKINYASEVHYYNYRIVSSRISRNDYEVRHPERSFSTRTTNMQANNARYLPNTRAAESSRSAVSSGSTTRRATSNNRTITATTPSRSTSTTQGSTTTRTASGTTGTRSSTTTTTPSRSTSTSQGSTTTRTASGTTGTRTSTTTTTPSRSTSTTQGSTTTRTASGTTGTRTSTATTTPSRSTSTSQGSTTTRTASGSANTRQSNAQTSTKRDSSTTKSTQTSSSRSTTTNSNTRTSTTSGTTRNTSNSRR